MKQNVTLCLDEEIVKELKNSDNRSGLVNSLLIDHFQKAKPFMEIAKEKTLEAEKALAAAEEAKKEAEKINAESIKAAETINKQDEDYKNSPERWEKVRALQREAFKPYEKSCGENVEETFNIYFSMFQRDKVQNLREFAEKHGLKKEEKNAEQKL